MVVSADSAINRYKSRFHRSKSRGGLRVARNMAVKALPLMLTTATNIGRPFERRTV